MKTVVVEAFYGLPGPKFDSKESPSNIVSCAQWVPMFELLFYNTLFGPGLMWL